MTLTGASVNGAADSNVVTITMTELQRVTAISLSGTPGGDADGPLLLDIVAAGMHDIALNGVAESLGVAVAETADTVRPVIVGAAIDYNDGRITLTAEEFIDVEPAANVDLSKLTPLPPYPPAKGRFHRSLLHSKTIVYFEYFMENLVGFLKPHINNMNPPSRAHRSVTLRPSFKH